jgi:hypothetical protein
LVLQADVMVALSALSQQEGTLDKALHGTSEALLLADVTDLLYQMEC